MKVVAALITAAALTASGVAHADDDCQSPMADWKPRAEVTAYLATLQITADRLGTDDGCYEVKGRDIDGNRVELKIEPATLDVMQLDVQFRPGASASRYLPGARAATGGSGQPAAGGPGASGAAGGTKVEIN